MFRYLVQISHTLHIKDIYQKHHKLLRDFAKDLVIYIYYYLYYLPNN